MEKINSIAIIFFVMLFLLSSGVVVDGWRKWTVDHSFRFLTNQKQAIPIGESLCACPVAVSCVRCIEGAQLGCYLCQYYNTWTNGCQEKIMSCKFAGPWVQ